MGDKKYTLIPYSNSLVHEARRMKKNPTKAEAFFWRNVRFGNLGWKCLRQKPLRNFIVDFYFPGLLFAVEIDGEIHNDQIEYDQQRTLFLERFGIKLIRYTNEQVLERWPWVREHLIDQLKQHEKVLPLGEGLGWG